LDSRQGKGFIFTPEMPRLALGPTQPPIQWVMRDFFPGIEHVQPEADYLPPSSAEANSEWSCSSTPPIQLYVLGCAALTYFTCTWFGYNSSSSLL